MKTLFGVGGIVGIGAALGPLGWLLWYLSHGPLSETSMYQLTIAILVALLFDVSSLLGRSLVGGTRRRPRITLGE